MAERRQITLPFSPRPWQVPLLNDPAKRIVAVVHRRAGKSTALMWMGIKRCLTERKPMARVIDILPYSVMWQRTGLWDQLAEAARNIPGAEVRRGNMSVSFPNGSVLQCGGADNQDSWRGAYADLVVLDEADDTPPTMVPLVIEPMLADRDGTLVRSGTPKGRGVLQAAYDRARTTPGYSSYLLDYRKTGALPDTAIERLRQEMSLEEFQQELECSFEAPNSGSYYGRLMQEAEEQGRICMVPHEPSLRVWTAFDLGIDDSTAIWFLQTTRAGEWRLIDYIEGSGEALEYYVRLMQLRNYVYERHLLPHDSEVRELGSGRTRTETLHGLGLKPTRVVRQHNVADGIQAVRSVLPRCWFDAERCALGIRALRNYRREWNENAQTWRSTPVHDHASHGCLTGDSLVLTNEGERRIDRMRVGDRVWTPVGYAEVTAAGPTKRASELMLITLADGRTLRCTPEHKIATNRGFVRADALRYLDCVLSGNEWQSLLIGSYSRARSIGFRATITDAMNGASQGHLTCTARFGRAIMALCRTAARFITETAIHLTTPWRTLSASMPSSINASMLWKDMQQEGCNRRGSWRGIEPPNGMGVQRVSAGMQGMDAKPGIAASGLTSLARTAVRYLLRRSRRERSGVISIARWKTSANGAESQLVYDLSVKKQSCYRANGVLVSNSDSFRYLALGVRDGERRPLAEPQWASQYETVSQPGGMVSTNWMMS